MTALTGLASVQLDTDDTRAFLQRRVSLMAAVCTVFSVLIQITVRGMSFKLRGTMYGAGLDWTPNGHLVVLGLVALIWWRTRSRRRSELEVAVSDVATILLPITFSLFALWSAPPAVRPDLVNVIGATNLIVLRALLIPSSG